MTVTDINLTERRRVARKRRRCQSGMARGCTPIEPGDVYLESKEFPGGESGYADAAGHPVRMALCAPCAARHDRHLFVLDPVPYDQLCRQGLL